MYLISFKQHQLISEFFSQNQDHYLVLGLGHLRYKASQKQIKAARKYLALILCDENALACVDSSLQFFKKTDFKKKTFDLLYIAFQQKCSANCWYKNAD